MSSPKTGDIIRMVFFGAIIFIVSFASRLLLLYSNLLWFEAVGYQQVFWRGLYFQALYGLGVAVFIFIFLSLNLLYVRVPKKWLVAVAFVALIIGVMSSGGWESAAQHFFGVAFNEKDPIFQNDIGFYVFTYPFLEQIVDLVFLSLILSTVAVGAFYVIKGDLVLPQVVQDTVTSELGVSVLSSPAGMKLSQKVKQHGCILLGLFFLTIAFNHLLARYQVLYSFTGIVFGATYTDVSVTLPALLVASVFALLAAGVCFTRKLNYVKAAVMVYLIVSLVGLVILPTVVQRYKVQPSEIQLEKPYMDTNIRFTKLGYGLDSVDERFISQVETQVELPPSEQINNIRLWDWRPLKASYRQMQEIRSYYSFNDVDIDRYHLSSGYRQIMMSPREIDTDKLSSKAKNWVNEHIIYTHGYGVVGNDVNQVTGEGQPEYIIQDIPPKTDEEKLRLTQPGIYYGELTHNYVLVNTTQDEFDYPSGDVNKNVRYSGLGGVLLDSILKKIVFAVRERDMNLLLSEYITADSRIMTNRQIQKRVAEIAPHLKQTKDPYITVVDGRLKWIMDTYTTTDKFPYSLPTDDFNYIRNSVKAVVDAYDGRVTLYVVDGEDPLIKMYSRMYPGVYTPWSNMPVELRRHIRYPLDLFKIQAELYSTYHMTDTQVFYNREDQWEIPDEVYGQGTTTRMEPYYILTKIPGEEEIQFILVQPFTPRGRDNMISWMVGKSDEDYGKLIVYKYPKDSLIYGPMQIEARIDQDDEISQQLTLWSQRGSNVIRGNLIIIPIPGGVLYVEPLYIQAENTGIPELKRVIGSLGDRVVMAKTLPEVLTALYQGESIPLNLGEEEPESQQTPEDQQTLLGEAYEQYTLAETLIRDGNWEGFGEYYSLLGETLKQALNQTN